MLSSNPKPFNKENEKIIILKAQLKAIAEKVPQVELDLRPYKDVLTDDLLKSILINEGKHLKKLILDDCMLLTDEVPSIIAEHCKNIEYLSTKNMPWQKWSTEGFFTDLKFPELKILIIEGCSRLNDIYIVAPKLQNSQDIIKVIHFIKYANWKLDELTAEYMREKKGIDPFYLGHPYNMPYLRWFINKNCEDTYVEMEKYLDERLKNNTIDTLALKEWGDPSRFIPPITKNIAKNTSLTMFSLRGISISLKGINVLLSSLMENKSLINLDLSQVNCYEILPPMYRDDDQHTRSVSLPCQNIIKLLHAHPQLEILDLSNNQINVVDIAHLLDTTKIKKLNLSDNNLGGNQGLSLLTNSLERNQSLVELNMDDTLPRDLSSLTKDNEYFFDFDDSSLIPFFNMLAHHSNLQSFSISGYLTDHSAMALANTLKNNKTLTHISIRQYSYLDPIPTTTPDGKWILTNGLWTFPHIYMTDQGAVLLAKSIQNNNTLTSLKLFNVLFNVKGFKALADAIENNTHLTECEIVMFKPLSCPWFKLSKYKDCYPRLTKEELAEIETQQARIQGYITRNLKLLENSQAYVHKPEEKQTLSVARTQQTMFAVTQVPEVKTSLPASLSALIPEGASADLQIKMLVACCDQLIMHAKTLDKELDRDEESKKEMKEIRDNQKLDDYYLKICELSYFIRASQSITTMLVALRDDGHDLAVKFAAKAGKATLSLLDFIPIVAGFSSLFDIAADSAEAIAHFNHSVDKDRRARNLMRFTHGLGVGADERLIERFARKLTLANKDKILHPEAYLDEHTQHDFIEWILKKTNSIVDTGLQALREHREGHTYSAEEKLALADMLKILEAIATGVVFPPTRGNSQESMDQILDTMLNFMNPKAQNESQLRLG